MAMCKFKKEDEVIVIAGKDKGKRGSVRTVLSNGKIIVDGINVAKKHVKPNHQSGEQGGIVDKEMPLDMSNVKIFNPQTEKGDRVGFKILEDGKKVRCFKSSGEIIDQ